jgi:hypothetical protein
VNQATLSQLIDEGALAPRFEAFVRDIEGLAYEIANELINHYGLAVDRDKLIDQLIRTASRRAQS